MGVSGKLLHEMLLKAINLAWRYFLEELRDINRGYNSCGDNFLGSGETSYLNKW